MSNWYERIGVQIVMSAAVLGLVWAIVTPIYMLKVHSSNIDILFIIKIGISIVLYFYLLILSGKGLEDFKYKKAIIISSYIAAVLTLIFIQYTFIEVLFVAGGTLLIVNKNPSIIENKHYNANEEKAIRVIVFTGIWGILVTMVFPLIFGNYIVNFFGLDYQIASFSFGFMFISYLYMGIALQWRREYKQFLIYASIIYCVISILFMSSVIIPCLCIVSLILLIIDGTK